MRRLARHIVQRLRPYRWSFVAAVARVFVMSALELLKPWPLKLIVDHVFTGLPVPWLWLRHLEPWGLLFVGCLMLVLVLRPSRRVQPQQQLHHHRPWSAARQRFSR